MPRGRTPYAWGGVLSFLRPDGPGTTRLASCAIRALFFYDFIEYVWNLV